MCVLMDVTNTCVCDVGDTTKPAVLCSTGRPQTHEYSCLSFQSPGNLNFVKPQPDVCVTYVLQDCEFYYLESTQVINVCVTNESGV